MRAFGSAPRANSSLTSGSRLPGSSPRRPPPLTDDALMPRARYQSASHVLTRPAAACSAVTP